MFWLGYFIQVFWTYLLTSNIKLDVNRLIATTYSWCEFYKGYDIVNNYEIKAKGNIYITVGVRCLEEKFSLIVEEDEELIEGSKCSNTLASVGPADDDWQAALYNILKSCRCEGGSKGCYIFREMNWHSRQSLIGWYFRWFYYLGRRHGCSRWGWWRIYRNIMWVSCGRSQVQRQSGWGRGYGGRSLKTIL